MSCAGTSRDDNIQPDQVHNPDPAWKGPCHGNGRRAHPVGQEQGANLPLNLLCDPSHPPGMCLRNAVKSTHEMHERRAPQ